MHRRIKENINQKPIFAIHGGGNIGLGLMADIVSKSTVDYKIVATSNDKLLKEVVNGGHHLWLKHKSNSSELTHIKDVTIISREFEDVVKLYRDASILAVCLTLTGMLDSAKIIAQGLIERYKAGRKNLNIYVLMNLPNCAEIVRNKITEEIYILLNNTDEAKKVCATINFIPTVVDRIVTKISQQDMQLQLKKHLLSCLSIDIPNQNWLNNLVRMLLDQPEKLAETVQKLGLKIYFFNAEKSFALYAPNHIDEIRNFPTIKFASDLNQLETIKNKYINGPHVIIAWLGALFGCTTMASAFTYPKMKQFIETIMDQEIAPVLLAEYPNLTKNELLLLKKIFFDRCENSTEDPVTRVGRDPLRKINSGERLRGIMEINKTRNLNISMRGLEIGIAAAILYAIKKLDPTNPEGQKISEIFNTNKSYYDVLHFHGVYKGFEFRGFNLIEDAVVRRIAKQITLLEKRYELLKKENPMSTHIRDNECSTSHLLLNLLSGQTKLTEAALIRHSSLQLTKHVLSKSPTISLPPLRFINNPKLVKENASPKNYSNKFRN